MRRLTVSTVVVIAALIATELAASASSSSDGQPLILGTSQSVSSQTAIRSEGTGGYPVFSIGAKTGDEAALEVGADGGTPAIRAQAETGLVSFGDVIISGATAQLYYGRTVIVSAGERRLTVNFGATRGVGNIGNGSWATAVVQEHRPNLWVTGVTVSDDRFVTIYLSRPVAHDVTVGLAVFGTT
jgi:hypothetical protein